MQTYNALEFNVILGQLADFAFSDGAKAKALALAPTYKESECQVRIGETTAARTLLDTFGSPPLVPMKELGKILDLAEKGAMLSPEQLGEILLFISSCRRMKRYLKKAEESENELSFLGRGLHELDELYEEIDRSIRGQMVDSAASSLLKDLRRKMEHAATAVKIKLDTILKSKREYFSDGFVTIRAGRYVLPVKKEHKNQVPGSVIETSGTGGTLFIEPTAVRKLQEEAAMLQIEEENEVRRILYTLTALVDSFAAELNLNRECMETLDFAFAKGKLSAGMQATPAVVKPGRTIKIIAGRHPLLDPKGCVPLDFTVGDGANGVIITGPNTGGKTVALKTVGLLQVMAQSGLHVPAAPGSEFCMRAGVFCDIGDGQSISENLSTFSSHMTNIIKILKEADHESLVLLDELGSGTDPAEGMGIAVAVLEELRKKECLFLVSTHYPRIKEYAANTDGVINARMAFDRESLEPLYKLEIGEAGESCALYIAKRLGLPDFMLKRAYEEAYSSAHTAETNKPDMIFSGGGEDTFATAKASRITEKKPAAPQGGGAAGKFSRGDSVRVYPQKTVGIVYAGADEMGLVGVQIQKTKQKISHKRLQLVAKAETMYPEDYDFSTVFDTVENRKARHQMEKRHRPDLVITHEGE